MRGNGYRSPGKRALPEYGEGTSTGFAGAYKTNKHCRNAIRREKYEQIK